MLLAVDIGNTNVVAGVFDGPSLIGIARWESSTRRMADEYIALLECALGRRGLACEHISGLAIASVVPPIGAVFEEIARHYLDLEPLAISSEVDAGIQLQVDNPREVGADRIANAVAVRHRHGTPAIVVDLGTATTFDVISIEGTYLGGAIAPGVHASLEGLFLHTFRLPRVNLVTPSSAIGKTTVQAIQVGTVLGYAALVDGLVERLRREMDGEPRIVATGGLAPLVAPSAASIQAVDAELTLHGIRYIYERNRPA